MLTNLNDFFKDVEFSIWDLIEDKVIWDKAKSGRKTVIFKIKIWEWNYKPSNEEEMSTILTTIENINLIFKSNKEMCK